ncbi:protein suppressor of variegation 3-7-like [Teleopsis dalmanni]|uniref:protein suppressor of variegation 3-7-like n=1 Tax=Teleopsis dalmanni TaxID=139649 RepID=UPI0018CF0E90|nr:protein suppressor of variegation 3-7-like [Teleopsis dalmanni]
MKNWMFNLQQSNKMSYCVLCDYLITRINFKRHTRTRHHLRFLSLIHKDEFIADKTADKIKNETLSFIENNNFVNDDLQKKYDWISYDPQNSLVALCKVCNKDITHPCSETKLKVHEKIAHGKQNPVELVNQMKDESVNQMKNETHNEVSHSESEENSEDSQDEESDYKTYQKKRIKRLSDEWFRVYKCYRKSDDPQYIYCNYCKVPLLPTFSRYKHEKCARHQQGVKRSLLEERKNQLKSKSKLHLGVFKRSIETKSLKSNDINNMKVKIMHLQKNHPWVQYNPKELQPDYVLCTICNDRVFVPTSDSVKKHEKKHYGGVNKVVYRREIENQFSYDNMENENNIISESLQCEILMPEDPKSDKHKKNMQNIDTNDEVQILEEPFIKVEKDDGSIYQTNPKRIQNSDTEETIMAKRGKYTEAHQSVDDAINILCKYKDKCTNANSSKSESSRNTYDLFFDSVSETVKKLPNDLAAEAKVRVSSIIYELEVRAMQREQEIVDSQNLSTATINENSITQNENHNLMNNSDGHNSFGNISTIQPFRTIPLTGQPASPVNPNSKLKLRIQKHITKPSSSTPVASSQKLLSFVRTSEQQLRITSNGESIENLGDNQETETIILGKNQTSNQLNPTDRQMTEASSTGLRARSLESMLQNAVLPVKLTSLPTSNLRQTNLFNFKNGVIRTKSTTDA